MKHMQCHGNKRGCGTVLPIPAGNILTRSKDSGHNVRCVDVLVREHTRSTLNGVARKLDKRPTGLQKIVCTPGAKEPHTHTHTRMELS
jgi:hypothetical protein